MSVNNHIWYISISFSILLYGDSMFYLIDQVVFNFFDIIITAEIYPSY